MRKAMRSIHLLLAIPTGGIITIICITGAIMVFQQQILEMLYPERYHVAAHNRNFQSIDIIIDKINKTLHNDTIQAVQLYADPTRTIQATLSKGSRNYVYINPYTGDITGYYNARAGFFHQVMRLHRWMMFSDRDIGKLLVGSTTLLMVIILISGAIRWLPHTKRQLSTALLIKRNSSKSRCLLDFHRVVGIYFGLWLLILALTGLMWSFEWYRNGVGSILGFEQSNSKTHISRSEAKQALDTPSWQTIYSVAKAELPEYKYIKIESNGKISILAHNAVHERSLDIYRYNNKNKKVIKSVSDNNPKSRSQLMGWAYAIHVGSWGGIWSQWLTLLAALVGSTLPITGYCLYLRRKLRNRVAQQERRSSKG